MNVLLIVIDTLRADHLGCYGYPLATSPNIDRLAAQGARFTHCFAPGIPTTPAHTTIYTGLHPISHNIVCHGGQVDLDRKIPVLPELLQQANYTTAAVDNLYDIKPWLARGYEFYINPSFRHKLRLLVSCEEINARAIPWLRQHKTETFFLFLHYWEPHTPYLPPQRYRMFYPSDKDPFSGPDTMEPVRHQPIWGMFHDIWFKKLGPVRDVNYISSLYDAEIRHVDEGIGQLLDALTEENLDQNTLVILTGDHGESLTEHDIYFEHHGLYDQTIHVPLIMRHPNYIRPNTVISEMVQHLDIAPTVLSAVGANPPPHMEGKSFWQPLIENRPFQGWDRIISCENTWQSKWALRTRDRKLILARRPDRHGMPPIELYDLAQDPAESRNLADSHADEAHALQEELECWISQELARIGRTEDPLLAQPISLGQKWDAWVRIGQETR
jgi:arylsulfatase